MEIGREGPNELSIAGATQNTVLKQDYLNLRLVRLKAAEQWASKGEGLAFVFPRAGTGRYVRGATTQPLSAGDLLVVNGDHGATISCAKGTEFAFSGFSLRLDHLFPLFATAEISLLESLVDGFKGYRFHPASSPLAQQCHQLVGEVSAQYNLDHRGQCLRLAATILNMEFMTARRKRTGFIRAEDHLVQVFEELSAEEMLQLSVPELAQRFGCSRRQLNRLFHRYLGFSVASLRMEMRLLKALSLLRNPDAKIFLVAEQCGFNHLGLFNICFRRRFKSSPSQWRKTMSQDTAEVTNGGIGVREDWQLQISGLGQRNGAALCKIERKPDRVSGASAPRSEVPPNLAPEPIRMSQRI